MESTPTPLPPPLPPSMQTERRRQRRTAVLLALLLGVLFLSAWMNRAATEASTNSTLLVKTPATSPNSTPTQEDSKFFPIYVPELPHTRGINENNLGQFDLAHFMYQRMLQYPARTTDPSQALFWFLPGHESCGGHSNCTTAQQKLLKQTPNASQTVLVASGSRPNRYWGKHDTELVLNNSFWKVTVEVFRHTLPEQRWIAVPYITTSLLPCKNATNSTNSSSSLSSLPQRYHKIACAVGERPWRMPLLEVCHNHSGVEFAKPETAAGYIALYERTTFSFQPEGDSWSRKGIFDALRAGNIPILFDERSFRLPYFVPFEQANNSIILHLPKYRSPPNNYDLIKQMTDYILHSIPSSHIHFMQTKIREVERLLHYSGCESEWEDDALWHLIQTMYYNESFTYNETNYF